MVKLAAVDLTNLQSLVLSGNDLGAEGVEKLAAVNLPSLKSLDLSDNKLGAATSSACQPGRRAARCAAATGAARGA